MSLPTACASTAIPRISNDSHPFVPFLERHVFVTTLGLVLFVGLSGFALLARHRDHMMVWQTGRMTSTRVRRMRLAASALVGLMVVTGIVWVFALWDAVPALPGFELSTAAIEARIHAWGPWGVAGSILLMILHSFIPFPAEMLAMANGMVYGPVWGTVITWTGAMLGAYLAFGLARWLGQPFVLAMVAERHRAVVERWAAEQGGPALLFSRLVPVISFNLINYAAGLTAISWWTFTWATGLGILPLTILMVLMGDGIWSGESNVWLWLVIVAFAGWLLWWLVMKRKSPRQTR